MENKYPFWRDRFDYYVTYDLMTSITVGVNEDSPEEALEKYPFATNEDEPRSLSYSKIVQANTVVESNYEYNHRWEDSKGRMEIRPRNGN